mgnify:CR=1 FL=1
MRDREEDRAPEAGEPRERARGEREVVPVVREDVQVGTRRRETGRVVVRTEPIEWREHVEAELERTDVDVERVEVGREVDEPQAVREEGDVTVIPVHEEVLIVRKQLFLKEEIHLRRRTSRRVESEEVTLRGERAVIERTGSADQGEE